MQQVQAELKEMLARRRGLPDRYAHVKAKTKSVFPVKPKDQDRSHLVAEEQRQFKRQLFLGEFDKMFKKVNKHMQDDLLLFRELDPSRILDFSSRPYKPPVEFDPEIPYSGYVPPPLKPIPQPKRRMIVSDWVVDSMHFQDRSKSVATEKDKTIAPKKEVAKRSGKAGKLLLDAFKSSSNSKLAKEYPLSTQRQKNVAARFQKNIKLVVDSMRHINLPIQEVVLKNLLIKKPLGRAGAADFFDAVKRNDTERCRQMLESCPYYVYDCDHSQMRPLHWAAKLGHWEVAKVLIEHKALPNVKDRVGRAAISLAIKERQRKLVLLLFSEGAAIPGDLKAEQCGNDYHMIFMVDKLQEVKKNCESKKLGKQSLRQILAQTFQMQF